jgi:hypothetical protein
MRVTSGIPLGCSLVLPVDTANCVQTLKVMHVAQNPPITQEAAGWIDLHFRDRWRSIVGVDDMIGLLVDELKTLNILDNTYIFVTSDHGYKLGECTVLFPLYQPTLPSNQGKQSAAASVMDISSESVRCAFFDRNSHSRSAIEFSRLYSSA